MTPKQEAEMLDETLARLGEHFDAVQILATAHDDEGTDYRSQGVGNWYARVGMAREFLKRDFQKDQAIRIRQESEAEDD